MEAQIPQDSPVSFEKVWAMFQETENKLRKMADR
jgi:hypothetical protein